MAVVVGAGLRTDLSLPIIVRLRSQLAAVVAIVILTSLPVAAAAADGQLPTKTLQKAAVACQKVIAQVSAKVAADKFKALDACANVALSCVQTKLGVDGCLAKAGQTCAKQLNKATVALTKAQAKIAAPTKSCAKELRLPDLLSTDGLGLGQVAGQCQNEFGLDICTGLDPLAACLVRTHERAAGSLYGDARPRTGELLTLLSDVVLPPVDGLRTFPGCDQCGKLDAPTCQQCSVLPSNPKSVEQCGRTLTKTTQTLVAKLEGAYGACAQKVFACVQTQADPSACLTKARAGCDKGADKITKVFGKFATAIAKKCGTGAIDFGQLASASGLNVDALAGSCASLGTTAPTSAETLAGCLQQRAQCTVADLVQQAVSRVGEFGDSGQLGNLGSDLTTNCPVVAPTLSARPAGQARVGIFGSITKIIKFIRRPRVDLTGVNKSGGRPDSTPGVGRGVRIVGAPPRITFGAITKIPFRYTLSRAPSSAVARLSEPPMLIVTVRREGVTLEDHFEIALDPAQVEDDLEVAYQDTLPGCALTLELAIRDGGVVGDYTPVLQVVDAAIPASTPTALPTPGVCGDGQVQSGEFCDGAGSGGACGADFACVNCNCACPTKVSFTGNATDPASILDTGWTGISHRSPILSDGTATVALSCNAASRPCGICSVSGPVANGPGQLANKRCANDTSIRCTSNTPCTAGGGTCQFFFGSNLPLVPDGIALCVVNQFNGPVSGTANVETGDAVTVANLTSRVYNGIAIDNPCARCVGDATLNDGVLGGTCSGGTRNGLACDGNGTVANRPDFGTTSLDCPPSAASLIATLPIDLTNAAGPVTKTLDASSPACTGAVGERCLCDTCNNLAATPCSSNADCVAVGGTVCGGKRCLGGANIGAPCVVNSGCPSSTCDRPGAPTAPSACLDDTATVGVLDCVDVADGEGACTQGPVDQNCSVASGHAQRGCTNDADCGGGVGSCEATNRSCFLTGGFTGTKIGTNTLVAVGMADAPMNDTANPTLGAVFCVAPTGSSAVNTLVGLPGPGRITTKGTAVGRP